MIGRYFTYNEMTATGTRAINRPNQQQLVNMVRLVALVLDPLRHEAGEIFINSGFRSKIVNRNAGGSKNSFHMLGCAADIRHREMQVEELAEMIERLGLPFDKVIMEHGQNSEWLHIQIAPPTDTNRGELWTAEWSDADQKMVYDKLV